MSANTEKLVEMLRDAAFTIGPSELDLVEATYMNRGKPLLFGKPHELAISPRIWALFPIGLSHTSHQYLIIGKNSSHGSMQGEFVLLAYDTRLRISSAAFLKDFNEGLELVKEIGTYKLPLETTSPFDGTVVTKLRQATACALAFDELRHKTRIKRGLPDILLRLERQGVLVCSRVEEKITRVALIT